MSSVVYDLLRESDIDAAIAIERAGYPPEEAASLEAFQYRQAEAGDLFLGAFLPNDQERSLIGYVCATSSPEPTLTHESMSKHVPSSASVCIHSVCVSGDHRRKGIALGLLREYIARLEKAHQEGSPYQRILLIVHEELRPLYEKAGFEFVGKSPVVHGPRPWYEMRRVLSGVASPAEPVIESSLLTDIAPRADLAALFQQSLNSRDRPTAKLLSSFSAGVQDLTDDSPEPHNKFDFLCPKPECGSVILKKGVANLADRDSVLLEPAEKQESPSWFPLLPEPGSSTQWWRITPNPMAFENIGFSRPVGGQLSPSGKRMKLLLCADCELGPLGWCEEGSSEFWLHPSRVGYRI